MYARTTSLLKLYIRNIISDDMGISSPAVLADRDGAMRFLPLLAAISVFEPVLVLLAVGHGGSFERLRFR